MALSDSLRVYEVEDDSLRLTRVMNFSKFNDLLESGTLHFAPASFFHDKLEGNYTKLNNQRTEEQLRAYGFDEAALRVAENARKLISTESQQVVVISCWTKATKITHEMWDTYTSSQNSLAIQTTVGKLRESLGKDFLFVPVRYLDFDNECIPRAHSLEPFFFKQKKYHWEREVRIIAEMEIGKKIGSARKCSVSIATLITGLEFHPKATKTFIKLVNEVIKDKAPDLKLSYSS